jgi:tripeptide aminopeptidase
LPANTEEALPVIGLIAHMDTSSDASGANVKVQLHQGYEGKDIILSEGNVLSPKDFPELLNYVGQDIITTDGTTLLGADDKAGICAIVSACEYLLAHDEVKHGKVRICFTPDEEVGRGTEHFPLESFGADFAYTVDGGELGELNYETFNACNATIVFNGVSVHPGFAKDKMRNAVTMAAEWQMALPADERPEYTEGYQGFYHTLRVNGGTDRVEIDMILRDHDKAILEERKQFVLALAEKMNAKYGANAVVCKLQDCYSNMKEYIMPKYEVVERAEKAMAKANVIPKIIPVRGGTDGARLSEMGLPCPNIFTGGHNFHGRFEYLPLQSLMKSTEVVINLIEA